MTVSPRPDPRRPGSYEVRILRRLVAGQRYADIAAAEYLSSRTVQRLVCDLKRATGTTSLPALCAEAARRGWLSESTRSAEPELRPS
jgi:DNA-binding CsgD family transcriptional regulator